MTAKSTRGERVRDFCAREQVTRRTLWRWVEKGVVKADRLAPRVGVRVQYVGTKTRDI